MAESKDLIHYLRKFNRKERYFLLKEALGLDEFKLGDKYRKKLETELNIIIPENAFSAMDYHLDWIDVSLRLWKKNINMVDTFENNLNIKGIRQLNSNQEDIDFLIAFKDEEKYILILIEAKAETSWTNNQLNSKIDRFNIIFGESCEKYESDVKVYFILTSPKNSEKLQITEWPNWMKKNNKPIWLKLKTEKSFYKITRCQQDGKPDINGIFCKIEEK